MDITTRADIEALIIAFYTKVKQDDTIGYIFNEVMQVNWDAHLPVMFDFWESILLDHPVYNRNAMGVHFEVNRKVKLEEKHFKRWLELFTGTVDELFAGETAEKGKKRARSIAEVMLYKMDHDNAGLSISTP